MSFINSDANCENTPYYKLGPESKSNITTVRRSKPLHPVNGEPFKSYLDRKSLADKKHPKTHPTSFKVFSDDLKIDSSVQTVKVRTKDADAQTNETSNPLLGGNYWELLAEKRRLALEETLQENEELHLKVEKLEAENQVLTQMAEQAEHLAKILKAVSGDYDELPSYESDSSSHDHTNSLPQSDSLFSVKDISEAESFHSMNKDENYDSYFDTLTS